MAEIAEANADKEIGVLQKTLLEQRQLVHKEQELKNKQAAVAKQERKNRIDVQTRLDAMTVWHKSPLLSSQDECCHNTWT